MPSTPTSIAVLVLVGGPQYRVGSHRQFVQLARSLATSGFTVFRFDVRGMGDSEGIKKDFQHVSNDIEAAKKALLLFDKKIESIVLWGLCDGASAALIYCHKYKDSRVKGLCLLNPWIRSESSFALNSVKYYYSKRIFQKDFWMKLLSGNILHSSIIEFLKKMRLFINSKFINIFNREIQNKPVVQPLAYQDIMEEAWVTFEGKILLFLSKKDFIAKEFKDQMADSPRWSNKNLNNYLCYEVSGADHTLTQASARHLVEQKTIHWLKSFNETYL
jgi:exosortase A-associated hydrolase 1